MFCWTRRDVAQELAHPLEGVVLALDGDDQLLGGCERVDREEAKGWGTVEQDEVIHPFPDHRHGLLQPGLSRELAHQLDLRSGQVDRGRDGVQAGHRRLHDGVADGSLGHDDVVDRGFASLMFDAHAGGGIALGVEVDHEHPVAEVGQRGAQAHGGRGFAHAALLVGDGDDPRDARRFGGDGLGFLRRGLGLGCGG